MTEQIISLAHMFLDRYRTTTKDIGLWRALDGDRFTLYATSNTPFYGGFMFHIRDPAYMDCLRLALTMCAGISEAHPELRPVVAAADRNGTQQWVEITDPADGEVVQINASPWYLAVNPGHATKVRYETDPVAALSRPVIINVSDTKDGPIISTRKVMSDLFVTVGFQLFWPRKNGDMLRYHGLGGSTYEEAMREAVAHAECMENPVFGQPEYRIHLYALRLAHPLAPDMQFMQFYISVPSAERLQAMLTTNPDFQALIRESAIEIGTTERLGRNYLDMPRPDMDALRARLVKKDMDEVSFDALRGEIPRVMRLSRAK